MGTWRNEAERRCLQVRAKVCKKLLEVEGEYPNVYDAIRNEERPTHNRNNPELISKILERVVEVTTEPLRKVDEAKKALEKVVCASYSAYIVLTSKLYGHTF